ncbi:hypothetical protein D9619_012567 [Psilocybe cf. subviscida]|uniref:EF-hand domain-containing protein n=1 Tax=Psilocybe cf. subviscida TaxID=2480587 RepID=A0A8H5B7N8_9AGAR|nr:hypothetical protein D9619_012567 [Psilocybe cf. subviscida]
MLIAPVLSPEVINARRRRGRYVSEASVFDFSHHAETGAACCAMSQFLPAPIPISILPGGQAPPSLATMAAALGSNSYSQFLGGGFNVLLFGVLSVQVCAYQNRLNAMAASDRQFASDLYYLGFPNDGVALKSIVYSVFILEALQSTLIARDIYDTFVFGGMVLQDANQLVKVHTLWLSVPVLTGLVLAVALKKIGDFDLAANTNSFTYMTGARQTNTNICRHTRTFLHRVVRLTVGTASATAVIAIVTLLLTVVGPIYPSYYQASVAVLGKMYSNSMMVMLNNRLVISSTDYDPRKWTPRNTDATSTFVLSELRFGHGAGEVPVNVCTESLNHHSYEHSPISPPTAMSSKFNNSGLGVGRPSGGGGSGLLTPGRPRARREASGVFSLFQAPQIAQFKEAFQLIDHDKDGWVGESDLKEIFASLGITPPRRTLDDLLSSRPGSGGGASSTDSERGINFTMFLTMMSERLFEFDAEAELLEAFASFDETDCGMVRVEDMRKWLSEVGERMDDTEMDRLFKGPFTDRQGNFNYREWVKVLRVNDDDEPQTM